MPRPSFGAASRAIDLESSVQYVKGIGPRRGEQLKAHGIQTIADLVEYPPFRYEDRTHFLPLASLREGVWTLARGQVASVGSFDSQRSRFSVLELLVSDRSGSVIVKFFNQPYLRSVYRPGIPLILYGQVRRDSRRGGALCLLNPECEIVEDDAGDSVHAGRIVPIYRRLGSLRARGLRTILHSLVTRLPTDLNDSIPSYLRRQWKLPPRHLAIAQLHFPVLQQTSPEGCRRELDALSRGVSPAHKRLIFEELFEMEVGIAMVRERRGMIRKARTIRLHESVRNAIKKILPFHPTSAQKKVLREIAEDMGSPRVMNRLLQGDVGSGKTIVAAQAAIIAVENGYQVAVMAPTEILAEQHFYSFRRLLAPLDYGVGLLKGGQTAKRRRETLEGVRSGAVQIAIGTHALIQEGVEFKDLALVVVDEQHRFGVVQRNQLRAKGKDVDLLVMTATPIPRSLALTLYGDLDVSVIDELPPGRMPIGTTHIHEKDRRKIYAEIAAMIACGHQVYVVYPLIEESEKSDLRAATEMARHLKEVVFPDSRVGLLHGRMKSAEKELVMTSFAEGKIDILVATTVIEVGVDVANATLIVVEHAERFGLAQLHQLRGRVGRGPVQSRCILVADTEGSMEAERRLQILLETNDGFRIAEVDLELRGPGEIAGTRQSGIPIFKYANLVRDRKALEVARIEAERFLKKLRIQPDAEGLQIADLIRQRWRTRYGLTLAG